MYVSRKALSERAAELERYARQKGLILGSESAAGGPVARIGHLATRLGIDLKQAFDMEAPLVDPGSRSLH